MWTLSSTYSQREACFLWPRAPAQVGDHRQHRRAERRVGSGNRLATEEDAHPTAKAAPAKKTVAKKTAKKVAPQKRLVAKKVATKTVAKKAAPAKKTAAKKIVAKKVAAKKRLRSRLNK